MCTLMINKPAHSVKSEKQKNPNHCMHNKKHRVENLSKNSYNF